MMMSDALRAHAQALAFWLGQEERAVPIIGRSKRQQSVAASWKFTRTSFSGARNSDSSQEESAPAKVARNSPSLVYATSKAPLTSANSNQEEI